MKRNIIAFAAAALLVCVSRAANIGIYRGPRSLIVRVQFIHHNRVRLKGGP